MEIEVGEYIRTIEGIIGKIENINEFRPPENKYAVEINEELYFIGDKQLEGIKHSKNIIDLIEVGDYVNGGKVVEHAHEKGRLFVTCTYVGGKVFTTFEDYSWELTKDKEENIETIVTHEQIKEMEYRI